MALGFGDIYPYELKEIRKRRLDQWRVDREAANAAQRSNETVESAEILPTNSATEPVIFS